jgi:glycosyltransferase involved in cell wall biosynthesis
MISPPTVSVIMPSYNHADFILEAIESVISQDFADYELLIGDDGSRDDTVERIRSVRDPRLRLFDHRVNRGAAVVHNELVAQSRGRYVAVINSDDIWTPGKLSKQVAFLESHLDVGACFGRAQFIGRDGVAIPKDSLPFGSVFDVDNRSRGEWLRQFFLRGNYLCHPTLLMRREVYSRLGPYDNRLRQLPDFDMWVRLVKLSSFHIFPEEFIRFRILPGENASSDTGANAARLYNEHYFIARRFFDNVWTCRVFMPLRLLV